MPTIQKRGVNHLFFYLLLTLPHYNKNIKKQKGNINVKKNLLFNLCNHTTDTFNLIYHKFLAHNQRGKPNFLINAKHILSRNRHPTFTIAQKTKTLPHFRAWFKRNNRHNTPTIHHQRHTDITSNTLPDDSLYGL